MVPRPAAPRVRGGERPARPLATPYAAPRAGPRDRAGAAGAGLPGRRLVAVADGLARCGAAGFRTYRSHIHANVGCTPSTPPPSSSAPRGDRAAPRQPGAHRRAQPRRDAGPRPRRTPARPGRPGIVTMGSPMLAPGAHHALAHPQRRHAGPAEPGRGAGPDVGGLRRRRLRPGRASRSAGTRCRPASTSPRLLPRDGIVDWRACVDPLATPIEVTRLHLGMAVDPRRRSTRGRARGRCGGHRRALSARSRSRRKRAASTAGARS